MLMDGTLPDDLGSITGPQNILEIDPPPQMVAGHAVPEPASLALFCTALAGVGLLGRRAGARERAARKWGCQTARCGLRHSLPRGIPRTQHLMAHTHRSPVARRDSFFMLGGMSLALFERIALAIRSEEHTSEIQSPY